MGQRAPRVRQALLLCMESSGLQATGTTGTTPGSQIDLRADDHRPIAWQLEGVDRARRVPGHPDEQLLAPGPHRRGVGRLDRDLRNEVRGMLEVEVALEKTLLAAEPQRGRDVDRLVVAVPDRHVKHPEIVADLLDREPLEVLYVLDGDGDHRDNH